jgi:hypothetical protein
MMRPMMVDLPDPDGAEMMISLPCSISMRCIEKADG